MSKAVLVVVLALTGVFLAVIGFPFASSLFIALLLGWAIYLSLKPTLQKQETQQLPQCHTHNINLDHRVTVDVEVKPKRDGFKSDAKFYPWENN